MMEKTNKRNILKGLKRQTCRVCNCEDKFNFHVPDAIWERVVPEPYRNGVVCLSCFDELARAKEIDYSNSLEELYFAGNQAVFKFQAVAAQSA